MVAVHEDAAPGETVESALNKAKRQRDVEMPSLQKFTFAMIQVHVLRLVLDTNSGTGPTAGNDHDHGPRLGRCGKPRRRDAGRRPPGFGAPETKRDERDAEDHAESGSAWSEAGLGTDDATAEMKRPATEMARKKV